MRDSALQILLQVFTFAGLSSFAAEFGLVQDPLTNATIAASEESIVPHAPRSKVYKDFLGRLQAAVLSGDIIAIQGLYQTNGVAVERLSMELARWEPMLASDASPRVELYFKDLHTLPPKAREVWTKLAQGLTRREVTHLVGLSTTPESLRWVLPLMLIDDRLWIVLSDANDAQRGIEQP